MIAAHGQRILAALEGIASLEYTGWASQAAEAEDLTALCPGAWVQPGAADPTSEAGKGVHANVARAWLVVVTVSGDGQTPLELEASDLIDQVRRALTGLRLADQPPLRRLQYVREIEPFYAPGYIELAIEFEAHETYTGDDR